MSIRTACACVALSGCYSFSTLGRARVVPPRTLELFGAPAALVVASSSGVSVRPVADLGVRYGLADQVELDARLTTLGLTAGSRIQLERSASTSAGFDVLLAPALVYTADIGGEGGNKIGLELPLLVGWNVHHGDQLVLAPRLVYQLGLVEGAPGPASFLLGGASLGYVWQLSRRWALMPEVSLLTELWAQPGFSSNLENALGVQGSVGLLFDL